MVVDGSGDVYVGGIFTAYNGSISRRIVRINSDGSLDAGFAVGNGFDSSVDAMALDGSGDIYAGGAFTDYDGTSVTRIVRLNPDGSVDPGFSS